MAKEKSENPLEWVNLPRQWEGRTSKAVSAEYLPK